MKLRGSLLVIVCCLVVEFCNVNQKEYLFFRSSLLDRLFSISIIGLLFLLYPLVGHLADVYLTRYRSLKWSFGILIFITCLLIVIFGIGNAEFNLGQFKNLQRGIGDFFTIILCLFYTAGLGLFQANAIQFGLDHLLEAPTPKLIAFIHWYYWAQNVGTLALFYTAGSSNCLLDEVNMRINSTLPQLSNDALDRMGAIGYYIAFIVAATFILIRFLLTKKHLYIHKAGLNPFKNMYKFSSTL